MKQDLVSIVVPTYNRAGLIAETLDSILRQTHTNWECIVVDDGSTDDTAQVMQKYLHQDPRFQYHQRPQNRLKGANACRNYGLALSRGHYVMWVDSDDLMLEHHLQEHLKGHSENTGTAATVNKAAVFLDTPNQIVRDWSVIAPQQHLIEEMAETTVGWQTACVLWNSEILPEKPFMEDLSSSQEWTFHLMMVISGLQYRLLPQTTFLVREHQDRIGKQQSAQKNFSTFRSRQYIYELLQNKNKLQAATEKYLLVYILKALRASLQYGYFDNSFKILKFLINSLPNTAYKGKIMVVILIAAPFYALTKKGERLFKFS